jgi:hypothetical protein
MSKMPGCILRLRWLQRSALSMRRRILRQLSEALRLDAHAHVQSTYGDLFNKEKFHTAKKERELAVVHTFFEEHCNEPFEVKEFIKIEIEKLTQPVTRGTTIGRAGENAFLNSAKACLQTTIKRDRLSVLIGDDGIGRAGLNKELVSPRNAIPDDFQLCLRSKGGSVCQIILKQLIEGQWRIIPLPESGKSDPTMKQGDGAVNELVIDSLLNLPLGLRCGVVAFENSRRLYQTVRVKSDEKKRVGKGRSVDSFHASFDPWRRHKR